ncbi:hypothetical protein [Egicoccus halophilus]|uniref:Uncharacterized protein n=1 Tax=Egicoccus halophilus TaxID=1670830 RepID=A0A8J3EV54_9ACTN|nr:hypothetical protein [Egicoccus halophilus]GGI08502.1 hypothetical protein GCM10011354_29400 [Egicoccus halophilus]
MAVEVETVGPAQLEWDTGQRRGVLRFVEHGRGGRVEAERLVRRLQGWVGDSAVPYDFLVDCSEIVDVDASWRAIWGEHFRADRDHATLAWFNANPRIQLIVLMFIKGTGVTGQAFATEDEARDWLSGQRVPS